MVDRLRVQFDLMNHRLGARGRTVHPHSEGMSPRHSLCLSLARALLLTLSRSPSRALSREFYLLLYFHASLARNRTLPSDFEHKRPDQSRPDSGLDLSHDPGESHSEHSCCSFPARQRVFHGGSRSCTRPSAASLGLTVRLVWPLTERRVLEVDMLGSR